MPITDDFNAARFRPGAPWGHYESWFLRANDPSSRRALWIRYTLFAPRGCPDDAEGELWAIAFDGERGHHIAVYQTVDLKACRLGGGALDLAIGNARFTDSHLEGDAGDGRHRIGWSLRYAGGGGPLLLLPPSLYAGGFPKAKSLVGRVPIRCSGTLRVDGQSWAVNEWVGSQNHNWGSRHTDQYAWGQVCGFDGEPDSVLEVATARVRLGPLWSPPITPMVLWHGGRRWALNGLWRCLRRHRATVEGLDWRFTAAGDGLTVAGRIHAPAGSFVALAYRNPPGGEKCCLNTKIARCELRLGGPAASRPVSLVSEHGAAFEILTDDFDAHGIEVRNRRDTRG